MRDDIDDIFVDITEPFIRDDHLATGECLFDGDRLAGLLGILSGVGVVVALIQEFYRGATASLLDGTASPASAFFG